MTSTDTSGGKFALNSTVYDVAKDATTIYLPAFGTLYFALSSIWGWPFANEVVGTVAALVTFLGVCLKISTASYNNSDAKFDGALHIDTSDPTKDVYKLAVDTPLTEVADKSEITLKVKAPTSGDSQ